MKKIFTFLVAFLTTVSGAVWGQQEPEYTPLTNGSHLDITDNDTHHYTTNGTETSFYFVINGDYSPTIYLKDVNITTGGAAFEILDGADVTIILEGVNTITSNGDDAAVKVTVTSELTIHSSSTGILTINVPNSNDYAIGDNSALGCGTINIDGGTIKTNGTIGNGLWHGVRLNNSAILISQNVTGTGSNNDLAHGGVYFGEGETTGKIVDEAESFTLKSPIPEGYTINMDNKPFTVGEGGSIDVDKVINASVINAYKVSYKESTDAEINNYTHSALPSTKYVGAKYIPATWNANESTTQTDTKYQVLEGYWLDASNQLVKAGEKTDAGEPSGVVEVQYTAVWTLVEKNLIYSEDEGLSTDGSFRLWVPAAAPLTASENTSSEPDNTTLESVGLKYSDGTISKADELNITETGEKTVFMNLNSGSTNIGMSTINITIQEKEKEDISTSSDVKFAFLSGGTFEYEGNTIADQRVVSCTYGSTPITLSAHFTVSYSTDNGKTWTATLRDVVENGYKVKVTAKDESSVFKGEKVLDGTVSITPKSVKIESIEDEIYDMNNSVGSTPDYTDNKITLKEGSIIGDDNVELSGNVTGDISEYYLTPGTYEITYTITSSSPDAKNYTIPESATGKLIVKRTGNGDDPIKPGDPDEDETEIKIEDGEGGWKWSDKLNGYYRTYDAESHPLKVANTIYVKQKDAENGDWVAVPADAIKVSYTFTEEQTETEQNPYTGAIKDAGDYVASITIDGDMLGESGVLYSGKADDIKLFILPFDLNIAIKQLDASFIGKTTNITADLVTVTETLPKDEVPSYSGTITVSEEANDNGTYGVTFTDIKLVDAEGFNASNYNAKFTYNKKPLDEVTETEIPDITPGVNTDIDDGDEDDNNWELAAAGDAYEIVYDGNGHGIKTVLLKDEQGEVIETLSVTDAEYYGEDGSEITGLPTNAGIYTAKVNAAGKAGIFSLRITERPLAICFDLSGLSEEYTGYPLDASEFVDYREVQGEAISGLVEGQTPGKLEGTITIASEPNADGKYAVTFENIAPVENGAFSPRNYKEHYYLDGVEIDLSTGGNTVGDGDDDFPGIEIDDNTSSGGSGIGTKRYQLFLANKDYTFLDVKTDYADEGLELFSRHDKKYTKVGGSFTVWYEKDGVANAGGYRIFWSNKANGDYKEVKFDTVSEYFQIRNVQSDVYVKIYAADGFPVGNEEISAADYRAYAQPNKIVVITPQPTDVQIISMAGAVVATDKVTGQREFANLTEGVYIVRMGETVVKLQVRK